MPMIVKAAAPLSFQRVNVVWPWTGRGFAASSSVSVWGMHRLRVEQGVPGNASFNPLANSSYLNRKLNTIVIWFSIA